MIGWRTQPMYSYREVSHLSGVSASTVRNWLHGYSTEQGEIKPPLFAGHLEDVKTCSFLQLIEIVVAARFRKAERLPFQTVRHAYDNARRLFNLEYPFAHMRLKAIGGHIVHIMHVPDVSYQAIDSPEQYTLPDLVQQILTDQLDFHEELASRWYPIGKNIPIVVDPRISAGLPVIKDRGVTLDTIYNRFKANQAIESIERDFEFEAGIVENVIRFREKVAA
jgi:uncharacterized protein (DUF433 family)